MQTKNTAGKWVGRIKALAVVLLFVGLLVGTCHTPRSSAASLAPAQNQEIAHSGLSPAESTVESGRDSSPLLADHRDDSIPITLARLDAEDSPVILQLAPVDQEIVDRALLDYFRCGGGSRDAVDGDGTSLRLSSAC